MGVFLNYGTLCGLFLRPVSVLGGVLELKMLFTANTRVTVYCVVDDTVAKYGWMVYL